MLNRFARALFTRILTPDRGLPRAPRGQPGRGHPDRHPRRRRRRARLLPARRVLLGHGRHHRFVFSDLIDGTMARMTERSSRWGAWLDSTLDRVGDAAVFGGLALWFAGDGDDLLLVAPLPLLPVHRRGRLLRPGPRRGPRHDGERRHHRARRPAGRDPGRHRPGRPRRAVRPGRWRCGCSRSAARSRSASGPSPCAARRSPRPRDAGVREQADLPAVRRRRGRSCDGCPSGWRTRLFDLVADLVWRRRGAAVRRLEANLRRARPDGRRRRAARAVPGRACAPTCATGATRSGCRTGAGTGSSSSVRVVGEDYLRASTGPAERGVVGALMHMGNWDHAGAWASPHRRAGRHRRRAAAARSGSTTGSSPTARGSGMEILPLTGGDGDLLDVLSAAAAGRPAGAAARRPRPARQRHRGRPARRADPDAARARRCSRCAPGRRCTR